MVGPCNRPHLGFILQRDWEMPNAEEPRTPRGPNQPPVWQCESGPPDWARWGIRSMSSFPGRYALRDLGGPVESSETRIIVARFVVLQLAERVVCGMVWPAELEVERTAVLPYLSAVRGIAPLDWVRLSELMAAVAAGDPRGVGLACLATAQPALTRGHRYGAYGLRSEEHTSELQSQSNLVCRLLLE